MTGNEDRHREVLRLAERIRPLQIVALVLSALAVTFSVLSIIEANACSRSLDQIRLYAPHARTLP